MRFFFLLFYVFSQLWHFTAAKTAGQRTSEQLLHHIASDPELRSSWLGISVYSLTQKRTLFEHEATKAFVPASTLKLLTAAAALEVLGKQFRFNTTFTCDAISPDGVIQGNLYLLAGADPTFASNKFPTTAAPLLKQAFVKWIEEKGIRQVTGKFVVCTGKTDRWGPSPGWSWEDLGWYYGAAPSPVSFADNHVELVFQTKPDQTAPTLVTQNPSLPFMPWTYRLTQTAKDIPANIRITGTDPSFSRILSGTLPYQTKETKLRISLPNPAYVAGKFFIQTLVEQNISIDSIPLVQESLPSPDSQTILGNWTSPVLTELLVKVLQDSDNLITEHLAIYLGETKNQTAPEFLTSFWLARGLDSLGLSLSDGSGLSRYNAISPANLTQMLKYVYSSSHRDLFIQLLPKSGMQGTLQNIGSSRSLKGKVWAKSGSMSKVRGYAGYMVTTEMDTLAFAMLWNQFLCPSKKVNGLVEEFWSTWRK